MGYCPECNSKISVKTPKIGQIFICRACDTRLEVIDINPLELDWAFEDDLDDTFDEMDFDFDAESEDDIYEDE